MAFELNHLDLKLKRGPFQNNGASPWYTEISVGSGRQVLKFNLDTGLNYNWITSSRGAPDRCVHHGGLRFDCKNSTTLQWLSASEKTVDLGPWGTMIVEACRDVVTVSDSIVLPINLYLAKDYMSKNFEALNWDGGLGIPGGTEFVGPDSSFVVQRLLNNQILGDGKSSISATFDTGGDSPVCRLGDIGDLCANRRSHLFVEWDGYTGAGPKYQYLWTGKLEELRVGDRIVATDIHLCLDTGSSGWKGDPGIVGELISLAAATNESISLQIGKTDAGKPGTIEISPESYKVMIEEGDHKGDVIPQLFTDVPMPKLLIIGSVLLDLLVTQFEYKILRNGPLVRLHPVGVHLYNLKKDGPLCQRRRGSSPS